ncbi:MAG: hypothetical protein OXU61_09185, partial [Gammaproteobacteria bacterium]|nr:hypothetical protein [Gammaproteobacteria bacterium]
VIWLRLQSFMAVGLLRLKRKSAASIAQAGVPQHLAARRRRNPDSPAAASRRQPLWTTGLPYRARNGAFPLCFDNPAAGRPATLDFPFPFPRLRCCAPFRDESAPSPPEKTLRAAQSRISGWRSGIHNPMNVPPLR